MACSQHRVDASALHTPLRATCTCTCTSCIRKSIVNGYIVICVNFVYIRNVCVAINFKRMPYVCYTS